MSKKKEAAEPKEKVYRVLIPCANDETGKRYKVGDTVTDSDFPVAIIKDWLKADKPVLEEIKEGVE